VWPWSACDRLFLRSTLGKGGGGEEEKNERTPVTALVHPCCWFDRAVSGRKRGKEEKRRGEEGDQSARATPFFLSVIL